MEQEKEKSDNIAQYSVSELADSLRRAVEDRFGYVRVRGEIAGYRGPHTSGHGYFVLKDASARLDAVVWRTSLSRMRIKPLDGLEVIASGKISTFPSKSSYQIIVDSIEPAGAGALMTLLEARRRQFAEEGLFDANRKRPLPFLPRRLGVVTSPSGAVIRDILHRVAERFPMQVTLWPVRVQGDGAAEEIAAAILGFSNLPDDLEISRPDVLIVARGGGALEDLWSFNEEIVIRAVASSEIPLISAIGHETDWTLLDHVADQRAPTPTAAAEIATPIRAELTASLFQMEARATSAIGMRLKHEATALRSASRGVPSPNATHAALHHRIDSAFEVFISRINTDYMKRSVLLATIAKRLALIPLTVPLERMISLLQEKHFRLAHIYNLTKRLSRHKIDSLEFMINSYVTQKMNKQSETVSEIYSKLYTIRFIYVQSILLFQERTNNSALFLHSYIRQNRDNWNSNIIHLHHLLQSVSYRAVLSRGYALVSKPSGELLTNSKDAQTGGNIVLRFQDGTVPASVRRMGQRSSRKTADTTNQKTLF